MNVSLTSELDRYVEEKVKTGRYRSAGEVIREALRFFQDHNDAQRQKIEKSWAQMERAERLAPEQSRGNMKQKKGAWIAAKETRQ